MAYSSMLYSENATIKFIIPGSYDEPGSWNFPEKLPPLCSSQLEKKMTIPIFEVGKKKCLFRSGIIIFFSNFEKQVKFLAANFELICQKHACRTTNSQFLQILSGWVYFPLRWSVHLQNAIFSSYFVKIRWKKFSCISKLEKKKMVIPVRNKHFFFSSFFEVFWS